MTKLVYNQSILKVVQNIQFLGPEKRGGILKPQGSLEKSREEKELVLLSNGENSDVAGNSLPLSVATGGKDLAKQKRVRQNVALQSIFKKMEENKQVLVNYLAADS